MAQAGAQAGAQARGMRTGARRQRGPHRRRSGPGKAAGAATRRMLMGALAALLVLGGCAGRVPGVIGQACLNSDRPAATPALCSCVQQVANQTLTSAEQRRAAQFFRNPERAQEVRQSDRPGDERFWLRYRAFADRAAAICG